MALDKVKIAILILKKNQKRKYQKEKIHQKADSYGPNAVNPSCPAPIL